jgi:thiol-disulfide isomerase/thioredoxin
VAAFNLTQGIEGF